MTGASAGAQPLNQFIGFGDSSIDSGYYRALASPGGGAIFNAFWASAVASGAGKPTTSPGLMNSEALAALLGLSALPANQPGGTNFATSGAKNVTINNAVTGGFTAAVPTVTQIANYLAATNGRANSNAIYVISSGANDVSFATGNSGNGPFPADPAAYLVGAANGLAAAVAQLHGAGAQYFIVPGLNYSFSNATNQAARLLYTQALWSSLAAAKVNFIPADLNAARLAIAANPAMFGFQFIDTGNPACTQPAGVTTAWALLCSSNPAAPSHLVAPNADQTHLFADDQHLTTAGQKIVADYEYSLLVAPSQISFLAEAPIKTRAGIVNTVFNQIPISFSQPGSFHGWVSGDVSWLRMRNAPNFPDGPGTPVAATAGFDYRWAPDWLVGAAFSFGTSRQTFSLGGDFKDDELAVSVYAAYRSNPYWFNVMASAGSLRFDVNRQVPIGVTVQSNRGSTNGSNLSFAAETGYDFRTRIGDSSATPVMPLKAQPAGIYITHGPVVGVVLQRVRVDGFTETDQFAAIGGFTALAFGDQVRNSAVSELGYQASVDLGRWRPFAKAVWNHEFVDNDRLVTASLTTVAAPSFSLPAVDLGRDWGTGTLGTALTLTPGWTGYVAVISQVAQARVTNYGAQFGVNFAFDRPRSSS